MNCFLDKRIQGLIDVILVYWVSGAYPDRLRYVECVSQLSINKCVKHNVKTLKVNVDAFLECLVEKTQGRANA